MKNLFKKYSHYLRVVLPFVLLSVLLAVAMPRKETFKYEYQRGGEWEYETLVAKFSFPILKTERQLEQDRAIQQTRIPYYKYNDFVCDEVLRKVSEEVRRDSALLAVIRSAYEVGVISSDFSDVDSYLREGMSTELIYLQRDGIEQTAVRADFYTEDQLESQVEMYLRERPFFESLFSPSVSRMMDKIRPLLRRNMYFDASMTSTKYNESLLPVSPTLGVFHAGDVIVSEGEIVTAEIEQLLDSYKAEFTTTSSYNGPMAMMIAGNALIALILTAILVVLIWFIRPYALDRPNELYFIITVFLIAASVSMSFSGLPSKWLYIVPFPVFALYYQAFFRNRFVLPLYILCLMPMLIVCQGATKVFFVQLVAGCVGIVSFMRFNKGWRQFIAALLIFASMLVTYLAFNLTADATRLLDKYELYYMALGSLFCVFTYPVIYLFEIMFRLISASRLIELTDTNNTLLRTLADKAPGTFHHSLSVMTMADTVGRMVDANVLLLRAAAMYHDVGKINNPQCFVENQAAGMDYHENLSPKDSAADIIKHVHDGLAIAEKHGVPEVVREFIACHHGTTSTGYFYTKYLNEGGDPADSAEFFYPGPKPKTKEQVILMICDSVEAASRSLKDFSQESIDRLVDKIFDSKMESGQYLDSDITLHELEKVKDALKNYLAQVYHRRIAYPAKKK